MTLSPVRRWSLPFAVLGSAALHVLLLCSLSSRPNLGAQKPVQVIEARLLAAPAIRTEPQPKVEAASEPAPPPESASTMHRDPPPAIDVPAPMAKQPPKDVPAEVRKQAPGPSQPVAVAPAPAPSSAPDSGAATNYLPISELDSPPRPLADIQPVYPLAAGLRSGEVVFDLLISANGAVEDVKIVEATPPGLFEASAISAFVSTRFAPGMRAGVAVAARMRVAVQYAAGMNPAVVGEAGRR